MQAASCIDAPAMTDNAADDSNRWRIDEHRMRVWAGKRTTIQKVHRIAFIKLSPAWCRSISEWLGEYTVEFRLLQVDMLGT